MFGVAEIKFEYTSQVQSLCESFSQGRTILALLRQYSRAKRVEIAELCWFLFLLFSLMFYLLHILLFYYFVFRSLSVVFWREIVVFGFGTLICTL